MRSRSRSFLFRRCGNRLDGRQRTRRAALGGPNLWLYGLRAPSTRLLTAFSLLVLASATTAHAGAVDDCNQVREPVRQLRGCTAYIQSHPDQPGNLATAFLNRANIYA